MENIDDVFPKKEEQEKSLSIDEKLQCAISEIVPAKEETVDDYLTIEERLQKAMLEAGMYRDEAERYRIEDELDKQQTRIRLRLIAKKCEEFQKKNC